MKLFGHREKWSVSQNLFTNLNKLLNWIKIFMRGLYWLDRLQISKRYSKNGKVKLLRPNVAKLYRCNFTQFLYRGKTENLQMRFNFALFKYISLERLWACCNSWNKERLAKFHWSGSRPAGCNPSPILKLKYLLRYS